MSSEETAGDRDGNYTLTRTFTATDDAGNSTSAQTITVEDTQHPSSRALPTTRLSALTRCLWTTRLRLTSSDVSITVGETLAGDAAGNYTIVRIPATDACGNSTSATDDYRRTQQLPELSIPTTLRSALTADP